MRKAFLSIEELDVEKVYTEEKDTAYTKIPKNLEKDVTDNIDDANKDDTVSDDLDEENKDQNISNESYDSALNAINVSCEDSSEFMQHVKGTAGYLKDIGIEYGPSVIKAIGKGVLYSISSLLKGVFYGTKALLSTVEDSLLSYKRSKVKIDTIKKSIKLLENAKRTKVTDSNKYKDTSVINGLKIGHSLDFIHNLNIYKTFLTNYAFGTTKKITGDLLSVKTLMGQLVSDRINLSGALMVDKSATTGLSKGNLQGYESPSDLNEVYYYRSTLPGDLLLIAYLPKESIKEADEIAAAYNTSKIFFGKSSKDLSGYPDCNFASLSEIKELLNVLESICDLSIKHTESLRVLEKERNSIKFTLRGVINTLLKKIDVTHTDTVLTKYIALKIRFIDQCYLTNIIDVEKISKRNIKKAILYCQASLIEISKK